MKINVFCGRDSGAKKMLEMFGQSHKRLTHGAEANLRDEHGKAAWCGDLNGSRMV